MSCPNCPHTRFDQVAYQLAKRCHVLQRRVGIEPDPREVEGVQRYEQKHPEHFSDGVTGYEDPS
jgi:hypothetical protein